ncbi:hypothetical protein B0H10DRAFT_1316401 [Mycena sp. CBHHK59/15]|nr:hypothetical protein B0H10DRAFT_1316401 [Mycena sp. CBHHK59/15]
MHPRLARPQPATPPARPLTASCGLRSPSAAVVHEDDLRRWLARPRTPPARYAPAHDARSYLPRTRSHNTYATRQTYTAPQDSRKDRGGIGHIAWLIATGCYEAGSSSLRWSRGVHQGMRDSACRDRDIWSGKSRYPSEARGGEGARRTQELALNFDHGSPQVCAHARRTSRRVLSGALPVMRSTREVYARVRCAKRLAWAEEGASEFGRASVRTRWGTQFGGSESTP